MGGTQKPQVMRTAGVDLLVGICDILLELRRVVAGEALYAAVNNFRRWNRLVRKPLAVSSYSLSPQQAEDLLGPVGIPLTLIRRTFDAFARRRQRSCSWSRARGEAPGRRVDALELFSGLALTCRATVKGKLSLLFSLFDSGETGVLTVDDLGAMISSCASFLRTIGLCPPISSDEAAFIAGGAFGLEQGRIVDSSSNGLECDADEISLPIFLAWAKRAELPARALELLALPHRLSRTVDLLLAKADSVLQERYVHGRKTTKNFSKGIENSTEEYSPTRVSTPLTHKTFLEQQKVGEDNNQRERDVSVGQRPLVLPPVLCGIGAHLAQIMLELRAATDHRVKISWGVDDDAETLKSKVALHSFNGDQHRRKECATLRFTTLPEDAVVIHPASESKGTLPLRQEPYPGKSCTILAERRCIKLLPLPGQSSKLTDNLTSRESVAVLVDYGKRTSVESADDNHADDPRWIASARSRDRLGNEMGSDVLMETWPPESPRNDNVQVPPAVAERADMHAPTAVSDVAPSSGTVLYQTEASGGEAPHSEPWAKGGATLSNNVDLIVHLSPDWRAVQVVRRCFHILEQCRFQSPSLREDGRRMVSAEINTAVRSLLFKSVREQSREQDRARRRCAHMILGELQNPWLGVNEDELMNRVESHCTIVRSEIELALHKYLPRDGAHAGDWIVESASVPPPSAFSTNGGTMAIGGGCFLIRPPKALQHESGISSRARDEVEAAAGGTDGPSGIVESDHNDSTEEEIAATASATAAAEDRVTAVLTDPQLPLAGKDVSNSTGSNTDIHEGGQTLANSDSSTTGTADDGAGPPPRIGPLPTATALHGASAPPDTSSPEKSLEGNDNQEVDFQLAVSASRSSADNDGVGEIDGQSNDTLAPQAVAENARETRSHGDAVTAEVEAIVSAKPGISTVETVVTSSTSGRASFAIDDADDSTEARRRKSRASHEEAAIAVVDGSDQQVGNGVTVARDIPEERAEKTTANNSASPGIKAGEESKMGLTADGCGGDEPGAKQNPSLQQSDEASDESCYNPSLRRLLRNMTCAAETIAAAAKCPFTLGQQPGATTVTSGCTAVVFLAAPLITPGLQPRRRFAKKKGLALSAIPADGSSLPDEVVRRKPSVLQSAAVSTDASAATAASAVAESKRGSGDFNVNTYPAAEAAVSVEALDDADTHNGDGDGSSDEDHRAGLGDPREVLEALLSWIGEGGCSVGGHREVLLICCAGDDPRDNDKGDPNANGVDNQQESVDDYPGGAVKGQEKSESEESAHSHLDQVLLQTRTVPNCEGLSRLAVAFPPPSPGTTPAVFSPQEGNEKRSLEGALANRVVPHQIVPHAENVRVLVGPVIGRVGPTSAVVLVEVGTKCPVAAQRTAAAARQRRELTDADKNPPEDDVGVRLVDTLTSESREMFGGRRTGGQPGIGPRVFEFEGLTPGRRYTLRLLGVRHHDQEALEEILADVQTARPTATATLAIGAMVNASKVGNVLYPLVMAEKGSGSSKPEGVPIGVRALNAFRELYRHTWNDPQMRKLLANTSTTPCSVGAGDLLLPLLRRFPSGWLPLHSAPLNPAYGNLKGARVRGSTTMTRKWSRRRGRRRTVLMREAKEVSRCQHEGGGVAGALGAVATAALQASKEYQEALLGGSANYGGGGGGGFERFSNIARGESACRGPLPTFQRWGAVGVLNISVTSSQVGWALGGRDAGHGLLSREAWAWLEDFFRAPELGLQEGPGVNTLIVATDSPLLWRSASSFSSSVAAAAAAREPADGEEDHHLDEGVGRWQRAPPGCVDGVAADNYDGDRYAPDEAPTTTAEREVPAAAVAPTVASGTSSSGGSSTHSTQGASSQRRNRAAAAGTGQVQGTRGRVFSVVCPATRVRMNIQSYVKDRETGRVATQWCLASKDTGDEACIPMNGCVGPRFSFTHYPQAGKAIGPGATLVRPIPDPSAPCVMFLGMVALGGGGGSGEGSGISGGSATSGPGFAFGTLGPILGEVGTTTARILVEVSVPMELSLTVQKSGIARNGNVSQPKGHRQHITKVIRIAHRPVVFEVSGLIADTRYELDFWPLANANEFRASLRTRQLRPFSFRIAAFGGSRHPFGFIAPTVTATAAGVSAGRRKVANYDSGRDTAHPDSGAGENTASPGNTLLVRERWPFRALEAGGGLRVIGSGVDGDDAAISRPESNRVAAAKADSERAWKHDSDSGSGGSGGDTAGLGSAEDSGGGWRHPVSTALAMGFLTNGPCLEEMSRESLFGKGGSDAISVCLRFGRLSAWQAMADEVELPVQGLDLVIHLGNEINAAASLNRDEVDKVAEHFSQHARFGGVELPSKEAVDQSALLEASGTKAGRSLLVRPPQLPVEDPMALGERDEEDISQLEAFIVKLHDEAEKDRKRDDGDFRHRRIEEPPLAIHMQLLEDEGKEDGGSPSHGGPGPDSDSGGDAIDSKDEDAGGGEGNGTISKRFDDDRVDGVDGAWELVAEEVAERVRDPYRVAWGLPWAKAVMASAPNTLLSFTPLDLDDGCQPLSMLPVDEQGATVPRQRASTDGGGGRRLDHPACVTRVREERLRAWVEYQTALAPGGGKTTKKTAGLDTVASADDKGGTDGGGGGSSSKSDKRETDRGSYQEYGGVGVLMLDVWGNQSWRLDEAGMATAKGGDAEGPGFHPKALLSRKQEKLVKKALASSTAIALVICSGTPMVAEPIVHPKAPPLSEAEQKSRDKALDFAKKELKKLGKAGLAEIKRMDEEEKIPKLAMLSPEEVGAMDAFYDELRPCYHWSYHSPETLQELLEKLFDWASEGAMPTKKKQPPRKREIVLLCGGTGCGVRTEVRDRRTGISFTQLCVGRVSDSTVPCPWPRAAGSIGDRIVFTHSPNQHVSPQEGASSETYAHRLGNSCDGSSGRSGGGSKSSFALVTVLSETLESNITATLVQPPGGGHAKAPPLRSADMENELLGAGVVSPRQEQSDEEGDGNSDDVAVILGPVVGRVEVVKQSGTVRESCRVPVVLEVDHEGEVTCMMRDVATSETFREVRWMKRRRPRAFWVQGLRPARRYAIEFEGVSNRRDRTGSLTTPDSSRPDLTLVAVSHDRPGELLPEGDEINIWSALGERLRSPWQGVEAVLHLGGQVDLSNAFEDGKICLEKIGERRKAGKVSEREEVSMMEALKERFREEYRKAWNQPSTRQVLASCQHIMMWGQGECRSGYGRRGHAAVSSWAGRRLLRAAKEVFHEYQRQLWDPLWGCPFQVGDNESFYTTFLGGTVGILYLDALELSPQWDYGGGTSIGSSTTSKEGTGSKAVSSLSTPDLGAAAEGGARDTGEGRRSSRREKPFIGDCQWQRLRTTLEQQEELVTLIVVTETPIAWHDTEAFVAETRDAGTGGNASGSDKPASHLEDHWASRPVQQRALLLRLLRWKADNEGKEVVLLAGAGLAEGCTAAETRLEYKLPALPQPLSERKGQEGGKKVDGGGQVDEEDQKQAQKSAKRRLIGIEQVTCGPITAEPTAPSGTTTARGALFVPLTEAEKAEKRLVKANSYKNNSSGGSSSSGSSNNSSGALLVGGGGVLKDEEPVTFTHLKTWGRNYAVLQVIADTDEEGPIGVVDSALVTSLSLDMNHPTNELARPPGWWSRRCIGDRAVLFDDDIYLKGRGFKATMDARNWLETNQDFTQTIRKSYDDFHIADCGRPVELRTIRVEKAAVLKRHVEDGIRAVFRTLPAEVAGELAYVHDQMILDFLMKKACPEVKASALDTAEKWEEVCRQICIQAAYIRVAALWAEEEEEVVLMADARAEEGVRKAEAKLRKQREQEVKDAEKDAAEMARLMANDPEAHMRRVVQKRADDADRRRREAKAKAEDQSAADEEHKAFENKKAVDKERLAKEAKEKEAREQQEMNELADSDPAEYDRRMKEWHKRKIEGRDGTSSSLGSDAVDHTESGDLKRRKSLARERRSARRVAMQTRPSIGIPNK
ncbi:unnamed protein product [Ectocarpus sp. 12 AP-2014]